MEGINNCMLIRSYNYRTIHEYLKALDITVTNNCLLIQSSSIFFRLVQF